MKRTETICLTKVLGSEPSLKSRDRKQHHTKHGDIGSRGNQKAYKRKLKRSNRIHVVTRLFNSASGKVPSLTGSYDGNKTISHAAGSTSTKRYNAQGHLAVFQGLCRESSGLVCRAQCSNEEVVFKAGDCVDDSETRDVFLEKCGLDQLVSNSFKGNASTILVATNDKYERDSLLFGSQEAVELLRGKSGALKLLKSGRGVLSDLVSQLKRQQLSFEENGYCCSLGISAYTIRGKKLSMVQDVFNLKARPLSVSACEEQPLGYVVNNLTILECTTASEAEIFMGKAIENYRNEFEAGCSHFILNIWTTVKPADFTTQGTVAEEKQPALNRPRRKEAKETWFGKLSVVMFGHLGQDSALDSKSGTVRGQQVQSTTSKPSTVRSQQVQSTTSKPSTFRNQHAQSTTSKSSTFRSQQVQLKADYTSLQYLLGSLTRQQEGKRVDHLDLSIHSDSCTISRVLIDGLFSKGAQTLLLAGLNANSSKFLDGELSLLHFVHNIFTGRTANAKGGTRRPVRAAPLPASSRASRSHTPTAGRQDLPSPLPRGLAAPARSREKQRKMPLGIAANSDARVEPEAGEEIKFNKRSLLKGITAHRRGIQQSSSPSLAPFIELPLSSQRTNSQSSKDLRIAALNDGLGPHVDIGATDCLFKLRQQVQPNSSNLPVLN